jgi:hypothetical protein
MRKEACLWIAATNILKWPEETEDSPTKTRQIAGSEARIRVGRSKDTTNRLIVVRLPQQIHHLPILTP